MPQFACERPGSNGNNNKVRRRMGCFCTLARSRLVQSDLELTVLGRLAPGRSVSLRPSDHPHHIMDLILSFVFLRGGPSPRGCLSSPSPDWTGDCRLHTVVLAWAPLRLHPRYSVTVTAGHIHILRSFLPEPCQTATNALLPPV